MHDAGEAACTVLRGTRRVQGHASAPVRRCRLRCAQPVVAEVTTPRGCSGLSGALSSCTATTSSHRVSTRTPWLCTPQPAHHTCTLRSYRVTTGVAMGSGTCVDGDHMRLCRRGVVEAARRGGDWQVAMATVMQVSESPAVWRDTAASLAASLARDRPMMASRLLVCLACVGFPFRLVLTNTCVCVHT